MNRGSAKERSVFVGNIPYDVTEEMLKEVFSGAGQVVNFRLVTDRETGKPKGYGFCEYADGATALSAMRNLNGYEINGRNLRVDFADGGDRPNANSGGGGGGGGMGNARDRDMGGGGMNSSHSAMGHDGGFGHSASNGGSSTYSSSGGLTGEALLNAIERAIETFGPVKLYDMLVELKEHARQKPELTRNILHANPALTHAIVQCFKSLNMAIPMSASDAQPAVLSAPKPPILGGNVGGGGGGILGMAPPEPSPMASSVPSVNPMGQMNAMPPSRGGGGGGAMDARASAVPLSSHQRSRDPRRARRD